jgi:hypothetical protein
MLIDTHDPRGINLEAFPSKIVAAVHVRSWEKNKDECPWGASEVHGEEGVWQLVDDVGRDYKRLTPFDQVEPYRLLFELRPVFLEPPRPHVLTRHRFLIRYWDADVYMPTTQSLQVTAMAHLEDGELVWSVSWGNHSLSGVRFRYE